MSFREEDLTRGPNAEGGGGYYPAIVGQKLGAGKYEIASKLGYGPRSSTWLVLRGENDNARYVALKIFTVTASDRAKNLELPILKAVNKISQTSRIGLPDFQGCFWEESDHGSHFCVLMNPLSTSIRVLQLDAENQRLPVHVVQHIIGAVAGGLESLHRLNIMHGAVKAENILFWTATQPEYLKPGLDSAKPIMTKVGKYLTVKSQPLAHSFKWNDKAKRVANWPINLDNFGHAQQVNYKPETNGKYLSAPETLLQNASCSPQTDIWMLGFTTYSLLTGREPFHTTGKASKRIAAMSTILEDEVPAEWLGDSKMKEYNADSHGLVGSIGGILSGVLHKDDAAEAAAFINACLRLDPQKRLTAKEAADHKWLGMSGACSCRFC